jgi:hypothetical protein
MSSLRSSDNPLAIAGGTGLLRVVRLLRLPRLVFVLSAREEGFFREGVDLDRREVDFDRVVRLLVFLVAKYVPLRVCHSFRPFWRVNCHCGLESL